MLCKFGHDMEQTPNFSWDDLRILIAIDDAGTLVGAAKALNVSHSTIYRRLGAIEEALRVKLFRRQENILVRTETADTVLAQARRIGREIDELARAATDADGKLSGVVHVAGPHALIAGFVAGHLMPFCRAYPRVRVALHAEFGVEMMLRGEADIGLRISMPVSDKLDIRRVGNCQFGLYGSARLAAEIAQALRDGEPLRTPYIDYCDDHAEVPETRWLRKLFGGASPVLQANATPVLLAAAKAGIGVAALPSYVGASAPGLKPIVMATPGPVEGLFIITRREQRGVARVRVLVDFLTKTFAAHKHVFCANAP
jgi:DNA-binding transcriptional LysR family regulator